VGSHTRWELTTWADFQLCLHRLLMSTGCKSSHGFLDVSRSNGGLSISGWIGQLSCLTIFSTIFNDLERPQTQISRSGHCLTLNISKMAKDTAIVTRAWIVWLWAVISSRTLQHDDIVALTWHNDVVVLQYRDSESDQFHTCTKCWTV